MTQPPALDAETRARIDAEEAYRAQVHAQHQRPVTLAPTTLGLIGCALLGLGTFAPAFHAPVVGDVNMSGTGNRDGIFFIALAVLGIPLSLFARNWLIWRACRGSHRRENR